MKLFRNTLVFSLFIYSFALPAFAQEAIDLELAKLMEAQNVGESNIRTRELHVLPMSNDLVYLGDFFNEMYSLYNGRGRPPYDYDVNNDRIITYRIYDVSFLANGQQKSLILGIEENKEHSSAEILQKVRAILGKMPERWLSKVHFIRIKRETNPNRKHGQFKLTGGAPFASSRGCNACSFWQQMFPQVSKG